MLTEDLERYGILEAELKAERKKYREKTKPIRDEMDLLKADIIRQVLATGKTTIVGNVKAEYVPTVVIKTRKEKENE